MAKKTEADDGRLDEAARAGWLYYVAGNTQDEIARKLGISRQSAQRLVSLAISERLIKVRLDHPIAKCLELGCGAQAKVRSAFLRSRADRSCFELDDAWHRPARGGGNGALAAQSRTRHHRHRNRAHNARRHRSIAGDGMSAA